MIFLTSNAPAFSRNLLDYARVSSKGFSVALQDQGRELSIELQRQFKTIRPEPGSNFSDSKIFKDAKARGFSVSRRGNDLVKSVDGVSERALKAAKTALNGQSVDYFQKRHDGTIQAVRFSARKGNKQVHARQIHRQRKTALLMAYQLPAERLAEVRQWQGNNGYVRMNMRSLSVYYELLYRRRGGLGGFMAAQWLFKTWKKAKRFDPASGYSAMLSTPRPAQLVQRDRHNQVIGTVNFETDSGGEVSAVLISGKVAGSGIQADKHGLIDRALSVRAADLLVAIANAHKKAARARGLN